MGTKELKTLYEQVDNLSFKEKKRLIVYLQEEPKTPSVEQIITQEELDMIYAVATKDSESINQ